MLTGKQLEQFEKIYQSDKYAEQTSSVIQREGIFAGMENPEKRGRLPFEFSIEVSSNGITDQGHSGRCWIFAALNCMRREVMVKYGLREFYFSQNYLAFYDLLEKANYFMENILETIELDTDERIVWELLKKPVQDAGQWDMFVNLVKKYGLVPLEVMPDTGISMNTRELDDFLWELLRYDAYILRERYRRGEDMQMLRKRISEMLYSVYRILRMALGNPPKILGTFCPEGKKLIPVQMTPQEFAEKHLGLTGELEEYVAVIHAPVRNRPMHKSYTVQYLGNVYGGSKVRYLNLPMQNLKRKIIAQLYGGEMVWIGADTRLFVDKENGVLDLELYSFKKLSEHEMMFSKGKNLEYGNSCLTHSLAIKGVNLDEQGNPDRWYVENSYGKYAGHDGYVMITGEWFDHYVYEAVIHKKYLNDEERKEYEAEPEILPLWDPIGALAQ